MEQYSEEDWDELRTVYLGMCGKVDALFQRFCDGLKDAEQALAIFPFRGHKKPLVLFARQFPLLLSEDPPLRSAHTDPEIVPADPAQIPIHRNQHGIYTGRPVFFYEKLFILQDDLLAQLPFS